MFKQRSSWASSLVTGLIGWNGFFIIVALAFGLSVSPVTLFLAGSLAAVAQIVILRLLFFKIHLDRNLGYGAVFGTISAAMLIVVDFALFPALTEHLVIWFLTAVYIGPAVGAFLSYFYKDDREIEAEAPAGQPVDYGRDGHWLEPFAFGAVAYLLVFMPHTGDIAVSALMVGAMSGVFAAGASHFVLFSKARRPILPFTIGLLGGALQGAVTGLLFRHYANALWLSPIALGAASGVLTYLMTITRGYTLARAEDLAEAAGDAA
ncbi:hypothetical protein CCAX7_005800 [Capsulimonas corticalis]|uniref:Uncharacterized protein n=1 Tax=Capsulimonas corticalis TaxID=2219043 RepID=A0A402D3G5_9BACT|nr:hypothetical protein [Capsulimonas corticalis]BDI28529.1 hypothetical protein CCAX7_005800 [Capsulimonas corticalis]